jgi:hypothetical protein
MKRKTKRTMSNRESGYFDKPKKVRPVGADGFYSDEPEQKNIKRPKPKKNFDSGNWWREKLGTDKPGQGRLAKSRKEAMDKKIKDSGG